MDVLVNIDVPNLAAAVRFYGKALGLKPARRLGKDIREMRGGSSEIYLLRKAAGTRATPAGKSKRSYRRHWTPVHLDFVVSNVRQATKRAVAAGGRLEADIQTYKWGSIAKMSDPFGNGFCLVEFRGKGYDEIKT